MNMEEEKHAVREIAQNLEMSRKNLANERRELKAGEVSVRDAEEAQELLQHLALAVQQTAHKKIANVVSSCLSSVFDKPYQFKIVFERKRGRTEASLVFERNGKQADPMSAAGGGVVDVAAFALRVSCLMLHRPRLRGLLVLDESFRFVSEQYQPNVRAMLENLAEKMGLQILMITHVDALATGKVIEI